MTKTFNIFIDLKKQFFDTILSWKMDDPLGTLEAETKEDAEVQVFKEADKLELPKGYTWNVRVEEVKQ